MKVIAYPTQNNPPQLIASPPKRMWMDNAANKNPYRCLPLSMANSWGWQLLSKAHFIAEWNGGPRHNDVKITPIEGTDFPVAHFGEGTLTWHLGYVFNTPYPYGMYMTGAPNNPKPNVIPLSGVVETHWLPYTATMNWRFTQIGSFEMHIGEPFCQLFPVDMGMFPEVTAEIRSMDEPEAKEFHDLYWDWNLSRGKFMVEQSHSMYGPEVWQKHYFKGVHPPDGSRKCPFHTTADGTTESVHITKPSVPEFENKTIGPFKTPDYYWERSNEISAMNAEFVKKNQEAQAAAEREAQLQAQQLTPMPTPAQAIERTVSAEELEAKILKYQEQLKVKIQPKLKSKKKKPNK
jgi:hypothetical protein